MFAFLLEPLVASLLLVVRPGAPSSFLFLVAMPGAPSSVLVPSRAPSLSLTGPGSAVGGLRAVSGGLISGSRLDRRLRGNSSSSLGFLNAIN